MVAVQALLSRQQDKLSVWGIMTELVYPLKIVAERDRTLSELTMRLLAT
jgi:hypothetical protein